jgi:hypothetical protein
MRIALIAALAVLALAPAAHANPPSTCTSRIVSFDVTAVEFTEHLTAHWDYGIEETDPKASIDTTQTAHVSWHNDGNTHAERVRHHDYAFLEELSGGCRVPNYRQGKIGAKAEDVAYHVDGTWSGGERTGTCATDRTVQRNVSGQFVRLSLATSPPSRSIGVKWLFGGPPEIDCPFSAFDGEEYVNRHLRTYDLSYPAQSYTIPKSKLLGRNRVIKLPVHIRSTRADWAYGKLRASLELTGTVTLTRYKDCSIRPGDKILGNPCLYP